MENDGSIVKSNLQKIRGHSRISATSETEQAAASETTAAEESLTVTTAAEGENVLTIGMGSCMTGYGAPWGITLNTAGVILANEYNSQGGIQIGDKKYKIQYIFEDTRFEPALCATIGEKLILKDKVKFICTAGTPIGVTMEGLARRNKVIIMEGSGSGRGVTPEHTYYFDVLFNIRAASKPFFTFIKEKHPEVTKVARITIDQVWDHAFSEGEQEALKELAPWGEWVGEVVYAPGVTDFMPTLTGVLAKNPDMIGIGYIGTDIPPVIRGLRELGYDGVIYLTDVGWGMPDIITALEGKVEYLDKTYAAEGIWHPYTEKILEYKQKYEATGQAWVDHAYNRIWAPYLLFEGLKKAGTVDDPDAIVKALEELKITDTAFPEPSDMFFGGEEWYGINHAWAFPAGVTAVENGEPVSLHQFLAIPK